MRINGARPTDSHPLWTRARRAPLLDTNELAAAKTTSQCRHWPVVVIVRLLRLSWGRRIRGRIISAVTPPMAAMLDERRLLLLTQARIELLRGGA